MIDDVDIKCIPIARLRNMLGVVLQDTFIFSGDIAENLKLSTDINKKDLENICKELGLDTLLKKLPDGLNTYLRERGGNLSSGCLLYTSPSPRDKRQSRMPSSA